MKKNAFWVKLFVLLFAAMFVFAGCNGSDDPKDPVDPPGPVDPVDPVEPPVWVEDQTYELILLHTNDHHGRVLSVSSGEGGLAERATYISSVRADNTNVLLVDAGDMNTGTPLSNMFNAEPDIKAYNLMGYDAVTFGNHEFDGNLAKIQNQIELAEYAYISSNIQTSTEQFLGGNQYLVKNYEGFRVGLIGITTLRTHQIASPDPTLTFLPEISAAQAAVDLLRDNEKAGVIIAITHLGDVKETSDFITSTDLAGGVTGIDIIVDGHSHSKYDEPQKAGDTWIISANEWGKYVGTGKLSIVNGVLADFDWELIEIVDYDPDSDIVAMLQPYIDEAEASLQEVVGQSTAEFDWASNSPRYGETAIGNMITDSFVWYFKEAFNQDLDFAFSNGGGIRANLPAGEITREDVMTVLPFENYLYAASLTGSQLQDVFDFIATIGQGVGAFPQFSKEVNYTLDAAAKTISDLTIGGDPIDPDKTYRFCTNDFILISGGDGYTVVSENASELFDTSLLVSTVVIEYIQAEGTITPALDGRVTVINGLPVQPPRD